MELLKDYGCTILHHPGKAKGIVDALSQKSMGSMAHIAMERRSIVQGLQDMDAQARDTFAMTILGSLGEHVFEFDGLLRYGSQIYKSDLDGLKEEILEEAHVTAYAVHPRATKMYHDLRSVYWWQRLKKDVKGYVSRCSVC
ncbi:Uncharacterized protein TCM_023471 [Theobroma cacao]|uniref:Integrase zinc-binding domain-containing protein n=1 Tax=Theobroma cacao TaxID=3641 RepID=A0A061EUZ9_THECC|nr:Uncharacterized protein TCM_023471 [Theobroma cacao]